jgi:hypothetical protein
MKDICDVMKIQTLRAIEGILQMDDSLTPADRKHRLALINNGHTTNGSTAPDKIVRRQEAATLLSHSPRFVDRLVRAGQLKKVTAKGARRGCGILMSSIAEFLSQTTASV